jgi:RNA polymerase sigma-70 factor, ECF subfamily
VTESEQKRIFEGWLASHKGLLFKVVRAYAFTPMDAEDLFQEIAVQVWRSIPLFRQESAVTTWIYRIAINTALKWTGRERKRARSEPIDDSPHILQEINEPEDERLAWLYAAIHELDAIDRSITLLLLDGLSYKEMAIIMGISESNVGVKINRIKKQLINQSKKIIHHGI